MSSSNNQPQHPSTRPVVDSRWNFIEMVSLCRELEHLSESSGHWLITVLVCLARCEVVEYGTRQPACLVAVPVGSVRSGLERLQAFVALLLGETDDLHTELHLLQARQFLRQALGSL